MTSNEPWDVAMSSCVNRRLASARIWLQTQKEAQVRLDGGQLRLAHLAVAAVDGLLVSSDCDDPRNPSRPGLTPQAIDPAFELLSSAWSVVLSSWGRPAGKVRDLIRDWSKAPSQSCPSSPSIALSHLSRVNPLG